MVEIHLGSICGTSPLSKVDLGIREKGAQPFGKAGACLQYVGHVSIPYK